MAISLLHGTRRALLGGQKLKPFDFDLAAITFTAAMAIRTGPSGVWDGAPIVQSKWITDANGDYLHFAQGAAVGNPTDDHYANSPDKYQGTISFIITPEWDGADANPFVWRRVFYNSAINVSVFNQTMRVSFASTNASSASIAGWTAGTSYYIVARYDYSNTLDGTNHICISIDDVHAFDGTAVSLAGSVSENWIGQYYSDTIDSCIEGFRIDDFVWWDGNYGDYGQSMGVNLVAYHAAGNDVADIIGSYGGKFCLPTNATPGQLTTTGQAWSHPLGILDQQDCWDGGVWGTPYAVEFNATTTVVNCGSGATLDDLPNGANGFQVGAWVRQDNSGEGGYATVAIKGNSFNSAWALYIQGTTVYLQVDCVTTDVLSRTAVGSLPLDGKYHFVYASVELVVQGGDGKGYIAIDGKWASTYLNQIAGSGAYVSDAALDMGIGARVSGDSVFGGGIAWVELWNNVAQRPVGTDFTPPTAYPAPGGNLVECWPAVAGTGATLAATVTSPANDGTITSGSWSSVWQDSGSPVLSQCLKFEQENDGVDFGSGANIDDLPSGDCTIEFWVRSPPDTTNAYYISKSDGSVGWQVYAGAGGNIITNFRHVTNNAYVSVTFPFDDQWHHYAADWDVGTLTVRVFVDGIFQGSGTAVGAYQADAAQDCILNGRQTVGVLDGKYGFGWLALSNSRRYTGASFAPPDRHNPPGNDANYHLLVDMTDGAGTTATDSSGNGYNGTITFGATTRWINDQDIATVSPGAQVFGNRGLEFGSDGANDGIVHEETVTASTDYVLRLVAHPGADGRGNFQVRLYDATGSAAIVTVKLPSYYGQHDGANNAADLTDANARWLNNQINAGAKVYNITDGSEETLLANPCDGAGTTLTTVLAGGTDNDWDTNDYYRIVWPTGGYKDHPVVLQFCFQTPAGCTSLQVFVEETSGEGTLYLHRVEVHANEWPNGDHESLTGGNPDLITGWSNSELDAGDTEAEAGTVHSGAQSLEWNTGATSGEWMYDAPNVGAGTFLAYLCWTYGDGSRGLVLGAINAHNGELQTGADNSFVGGVEAFWALQANVMRVVDATPVIGIAGRTGAVGDRFSDDFAAFLLDAVTLTVTPASEANSLESGGIRVDGYDNGPQVVPENRLKSQKGWIRTIWRPRHSDAQAVAFGNATPYVLDIHGDANNWIDVVWTAANTLRLRYNANGAGAVSANWATGGGAIVPDTAYLVEIKYTAGGAILYVDGVNRVQIVAPTGFVWPVPTTCYWGTADGLNQQTDAVYGQP